jgi:hypothetical protein
MDEISRNTAGPVASNNLRNIDVTACLKLATCHL